MKKTLLCISTIIVVVACESPAGQQAATNAADTIQATPATTQKMEEDSNSPVVFFVNDTAANTQKGAGNDAEEHIGLLNFLNMNLSLDLMGDVPARPHRGWLHFSIDNVRTEPGTYSTNNGLLLDYRRYGSANAGLPTEFTASNNAVDKGSEATITFTKFEKNNAASFGEEYLVSGTFSAKLLLKEANPYKRTSQESLTLSKGTFTDISVRVLGKKK